MSRPEDLNSGDHSQVIPGQLRPDITPKLLEVVQASQAARADIVTKRTRRRTQSRFERAKGLRP